MTRYILMIGLALTASGFGVEEKGGLRVRFLAERSPGSLGAVSMVVGDQRSEPFDLPVNHLSEPLKAPARSFQLRSKQPDLLLATVQLPEAGEAFVLLLVPNQPSGYQPVIIPDNDPAFRASDVYFYNLTGQAVMGYVGTSKFVVETGKGKVVTPAGPRAEKFYDVAFGIREGTANRMLASTRWPVDEQSRSYVFFFKNATTGRPDFRAVDEFIPPAEKQKTAAAE